LLPFPPLFSLPPFFLDPNNLPSFIPSNNVFSSFFLLPSLLLSSFPPFLIFSSFPFLLFSSFLFYFSSEEQKLEISKALIELKLANSEMAEKFETEKYEVTTHMLNARTEVADLDIKLRDVEEQLSQSQDKESQALSDHKEIRDQLEILDKANVEMRAKLSVEMDKATDLGTELLTLVNQKEAFGKENASLSAKCETQEVKLGELAGQVEKAKSEVSTLQESLEKEKLELENVRGEKMKVELELRKSSVGFEQSRLDLDKSTADFVRNRDNEMFQVRKNAEEDIAAVRREKEDLAKANNKLEAQVRTLERKIRDIENNIGRNVEQSNTLQREKRDLEATLKNERDNYRSKMLAYLGEEAMAAQLKNEEINKYLENGASAEEKKADSQQQQQQQSQSDAASDANNRVALESLIDTYKERERKMQQDVERLDQRNHDVTRKNHLLFDKYRTVRDLLEDVTEDSSTLPQDLSDEKDLKVTASELEQERDRELSALRTAVKTMQSDTAAEKGKSVQLSETYRERVMTMEGQLKTMTQSLTMVTSDKQRLELQMTEEKDKETLKQIEEMQQNIIEQLGNIKISADNIGPAAAAGGGGGMGEKERKELHDLRKRMKKVKAEEGNSKEEAGKYRNENMDLKEQLGKMKIKMLEGGGEGGAVTETGNATLRAQLRESEGRGMMLNSQVVALTQQMEDYEDHMKKTLRTYKAEIAALKGGI